MSRTDIYRESNDRPTDMNSLSECMEYLTRKGFKEQFRVEKQALHASSDDAVYFPEDVKLAHFYRFEGISNPDDTSILYAIETIDGRKGTLADAYGMYADQQVTDFMRGIEISKSSDSHSRG